MGLTHVTAKVWNLTKSKRPYEAAFLVELGAVDCLAPRSKLRQAGVRVEGRDTYELANGQPVEYDYGFARIAFMGDETVVRIILGPDDAEPILGVVALESIGIDVDTTNRTLKRMPAKPLK